MSDPSDNGLLPRGALLGAAALVCFALTAVLVSQESGIGTSSLPESAVVASLELRFVDRADGAVEVYSHADDTLVEVLPAGTNGFLRGTLRGLARYRKPYGVGAGRPFRLTRYADGRLSLDDPVTGEHIDLEAFGPANAGIFADLLTAAQSADRPDTRQTRAGASDGR